MSYSEKHCKSNVQHIMRAMGGYQERKSEGVVRKLGALTSSRDGVENFVQQVIRYAYGEFRIHGA